MIQGLNASDERFLSTLSQIDDRLSQVQREVSSGRRISTASDHPDEVSAVLSARANLEQTLQIQLNLGRAQTETSTAEQSLSSAVSLLDRVSSIAVQGATETQAPEQRSTIAVEVANILEQLVSIAGTQVEGRYIFSGDADQAVPYAMVQPPALPDGTVPDPVVSSYGGSDTTRQIMHPNGTRFDIAQTAQQIFDAPGASVFQAVMDLRDALKSGPTVPPDDPNYQAQYHAQTDALNAALTEVHNAQNQVSGSVAFYGVAQNRVDEATSFSNQLELRQREQLSAIQDADVTSSVLELNQAMTQRQTALAARAKQKNESLFDYLG
jgi:flagellar hook-associated protein 3 FlgL